MYMNSLINWFRKIFIPHESNEGEPHIFRDASVEIFLFVAIIGFVLAVGHRIVVRETNMLAAIYSSALIDMANADRKVANLSELRTSPLLEKAAALKADDMASKGYFAHYSPDGLSPWYWMRQAGYAYVYAGENLAIDFYDSADVNRAWMNSPTHRANLLNGRYTEIGIATRQGTYQGRPTTFVVQMFGSPKATSTVVSRGDELSLVASVGPFFGFVMTNPRYMMTSLFGAIAVMIILGLIGLATVEWRKRHFRHVILSLLILLVVLIFTFVYFGSSTFPQIAGMS
jgi:hypothetical protein